MKIPDIDELPPALLKDLVELGKLRCEGESKVEAAHKLRCIAREAIRWLYRIDDGVPEELANHHLDMPAMAGPISEGRGTYKKVLELPFDGGEKPLKLKDTKAKRDKFFKTVILMTEYFRYVRSMPLPDDAPDNVRAIHSIEDFSNATLNQWVDLILIELRKEADWLKDESYLIELAGDRLEDIMGRWRKRRKEAILKKYPMNDSPFTDACRETAEQQIDDAKPTAAQINEALRYYTRSKLKSLLKEKPRN